MSIEVKDLTRIYGEQKAIDQISFSVGRGEIVGFLGPNGAGKSTTMKILTGCLKPSQGQAFLNGIDVPFIRCRQKKSPATCPNPIRFMAICISANTFPLLPISTSSFEKEKINTDHRPGGPSAGSRKKNLPAFKRI